MKKIIILLQLSLLHFFCFSQTCNLITNGGFEISTGNPTGASQFALSTGWTTANGHTPDYYNTNGSGGYDVPTNVVSTGVGLQGNGGSNSYMGIGCHGDGNNGREYIARAFDCPLIQGQTYTLSLWVSLAGQSRVAIDRLGITFYNGPLLITGANTGIFPLPAANLPSGYLETPAGTFINNAGGWTQFTFVFTAISNFANFCIGNIYDDSANGTNTQAANPNGTYMSYYLIDDVSLTTNTITPFSLQVNPNPVCQGQSVTINVVNTYVPDYTYIWTNGTTTFTNNTGSYNYIPSASEGWTVTAMLPCCNMSVQATASVIVIPVPNANFTINPNPVCVCEQVCFTPSQSSSPNLEFDWGLGTISFTNNGGQVCNTYQNVGWHPITLTVTDLTTGCSTTSTQTLTINPFLATFTYTMSCKTVSFTPNVTCYGKLPANVSLIYNWTFLEPPGNQATSNAQNPVYTFTTGFASTFVYLDVINPITGCKSSTYVQGLIFQQPPTLTLSPSSQTICAGETATICVTNTSTPTGFSYSWTPLPGSLNSTSTCATMSPSVSTIYTVTLSNGTGTCASTAAGTVNVIPLPVAQINTSVTTTCDNFASAGYSAQTGTGYTYNWTVNGNYPVSFTGQGTPNITVNWGSPFNGGTIILTVTNPEKCTNTVTITVQPCCNIPPFTSISSMATPNLDVSPITSGVACAPNIYVLTGVFTINSPLYTLNNVVLYMMPGSQINVPSGKVWNLNNSHLLGCDKMWQGIKISTFGTLISKNTFIEDALIAIDMGDGASPVIDLKDVWFNRNGIAIKLANSGFGSSLKMENCVFTSRYNVNYQNCPPYVHTLFPTLPGYPNINSLTEAPLKINSVYPANAPAQYGIWAKQVVAGVINFFRTAGVHTRHLFDKVETGVFLDGSSCDVKYCTFSFTSFFNLTSPIQPQRAPIKITNITGSLLPSVNIGDMAPAALPGTLPSNFFTFTRNGVWCEKRVTLKVRANDFDWTLTGPASIYIKDANGVTDLVERNKITNTRFDAIFTDINNSGTITIKDNRITLNGAFTNLSAPNVLPRAIKIQEVNASTTIYTVENNLIKKYKEGISCTQVNAPAIKDNEIDMKPDQLATNPTFGIRILNCPAAKVTNNQCYDNFPNTSVSHGSQRAIEATFSPGSVIQCNNISGAGISLACLFPMFGTAIQNNQFIDAEATNFLLAFGSVGPQGGPGSPSWNQFSNPNTIGAFNPFTTFCFGSIGTLSPFFYENVTPYIPYLNGALLPVIPIPTGGIYALSTGGTAPACAYSPTPKLIMQGNVLPADYLDITENRLQNNHLLNYHSKNELYNLIKTGLVPKENAILNTFYKGLNTSNISTFAEIKEHLNYVANDSAIISISEIHMKNSSIVPENNIEENQKTVNSVYINYLVNNNVNSYDMMLLRSIAQKCPFEEGTAVYMARTLLSRVDSTVYYNDCGIDMEKALKNEPKENSITTEVGLISIMPNPNSGNFNLIRNSSEICSIKIIDLLGRIILEKDNISEKMIELDITKEKAAVYLVKIQTNNKIETKRIIKE